MPPDRRQSRPAATTAPSLSAPPPTRAPPRRTRERVPPPAAATRSRRRPDGPPAIPAVELRLRTLPDASEPRPHSWDLAVREHRCPRPERSLGNPPVGHDQVGGENAVS